jgi:lysozyme
MYCIERMADLLERHEGRRRWAYRDSEGYLTIGIGFNLDGEGLYDVEMDFILRNRIKLATIEIESAFPQFARLNAVRQIVLVDMTYNMGLTKLLGFQRMFIALDAQDYDAAAAEMLDSLWATQVGGRAIRLSNMMRTGRWEESG